MWVEDLVYWWRCGDLMILPLDGAISFHDVPLS